MQHESNSSKRKNEGSVFFPLCDESEYALPVSCACIQKGLISNRDAGTWVGRDEEGHTTNREGKLLVEGGRDE